MRSPKRFQSGVAARPFIALETLESRTHLSGASPSSAGTIDLTEMVSITGNSSVVKQGRPVSLAIAVTNTGTGTAAGILGINLALSSQPNGASATSFASLRSAIHLKAGGTATLHFARPVGRGLPAGTYYVVATIDPNNSFNESNISNNTAVSSGSFTVAPLYPVLAGTYSGTVDIISGPDAGLFGQITRNFRNESPAGVLVGDGTVSYDDGVNDDFTFLGNVSQAGRISERLLASTGGKATLVSATIVGDTITGIYRSQGDVVRFSESAIA